jgi:hypothetical protein
MQRASRESEKSGHERTRTILSCLQLYYLLVSEAPDYFSNQPQVNKAVQGKIRIPESARYLPDHLAASTCRLWQPWFFSAPVCSSFQGRLIRIVQLRNVLAV